MYAITSKRLTKSRVRARCFSVDDAAREPIPYVRVRDGLVDEPLEHADVHRYQVDEREAALLAKRDETGVLSTTVRALSSRRKR